jgi:hypothetical protein
MGCLFDVVSRIILLSFHVYQKRKRTGLYDLGSCDFHHAMKLYRCHFTNTCSASRKALRNASCFSMSFHESPYNRSTTHKKRSWHYLYYETPSQLLFVVSLDTISVSDHGVEDTGRGWCCMIQLSSGFHIPPNLVVTPRASHKALDLSIRSPHDVSSAPMAICMEMRHGTDCQTDTRKPHHHHRFPR